jgi:thiamine biosynthesis protein ThiI
MVVPLAAAAPRLPATFFCGRVAAPLRELPETYVVHYSEVALKGKNRPEFVRTLRRNIRRALASDREASLELDEGRFLLTTSAGPEEVTGGLSKVFGVAWFAKTSVVGPSYQELRDAALAVAGRGEAGSFRISARRVDKSFPLDSMEIERRLGAEVVKKTGRKVDLSDPDESVHVDVMRDKALVYSDRTRGPGGLPVGTAGRVIHLFSGGIDSPVAAWLLMKRGCVPVYLHFYLAPTPSYPLESKVLGLVKVLSAYSGKCTLLLIPFDEYQLAASEAAADLEPSLFRRFMRLTAEVLAPHLGASAISTGDCLSQAASQTLWNLAVFDAGSTLPILRPLLSYDKEEVVSIARKIGTYELSIQEYKDCCAIITRHPRTRARADIISRFSERLNFRELAIASIRKGTLATYNPAKGEVRTSSLAEARALLSGPARGRRSSQSEI